MKRPTAALLTAFAIGVALLQACPRLPPAPGVALVLAMCLAALSLCVGERIGRWRHCCRAGPLRAPSAETIFRERTGAGLFRVPADGRLIAACVAFLSVIAFGVTGFAYAAWRAQVRLADALPSQWEERDIRVTGVVDDLPHRATESTRFAFAVLHVDTEGAVVPRRISLAWFAPRTRDVRGAEERQVQPPVDGRANEASSAPATLRVAPDGDRVPVVHAGECWSLTVRLKRPHGNVNPGGFDLEAWLLERNLRASGYVRESPANARGCAFAGRFSDYVQSARERIRSRIGEALPSAPYAGMLTALAIGDQRAIPEAQWSVVNRTGVTHLVSISGLHVTVFATLAGIVAFAGIRRSTAVTTRVPARKLAVAAGVLFAFGYVLLAGAEVPAVRTLLMLVVVATGLWLGRPGTALLVWLWSLVAVLLWDPWATLTAGFWLSFGAVGLLLYAGCGRLGGTPRRGVQFRLLDAIRATARSQWVVTVGLVPGTLALFQQVSIVSAAANAVAIPAITLGVVPLALVAIASPIDLPWRIAHAILALTMRYLEWLAALPSATWTAHAPAGWTLVVAVAGVGWLLAPRGIPGRPLAVAWLAPLAMLPPASIPVGGVRVTVLDVGQGLAVVVATARHALVYDTGPRFNDTANAGARIIAPFLRATGISRLDALVVSHADSDHSGGALSVLDALPVARLLSSMPEAHPIVVATSRKRAPSAHCISGTAWTWDGVVFTLLHPGPAHYRDPARKTNDLSCVLRIEAAAGTVLLAGDIEASTEAELLRANPHELRSDVLVVPHHGSRMSSSADFVAAVAPRVTIVAAGYRNRFGHPRDEVLARYRRAGAAGARTDLQGAITVTLSPGLPIAAEAERERQRRYWYD